MVKKATYLLATVYFLALSGCTLEQRLARTFVKTEIHHDFYILKPSFIFKNNMKEFELAGSDTLDAIVKANLLLEKSLFLKSIVDTAMIAEYTAGLKKGLEKYGARVFPEDAVDTLLNNGGSTFILNLAQISLEEYIHPYSTEEVVYDEVIMIDGIDLNAVNYNVWLELGRMNSDEKNKVLFVSNYLLDQLDGTLKQNLVTGKLSFDYTIDTLTVPQMYSFARRFGERTAGYLYDYLMNTYISENIPEDYPYERLYYHYDPARNLILQDDEGQKLLELDSR